MTRSISLSLIALTLTVGCGVAPSGQDTSSEGSSGGVYAPLSGDDGSSSSGSDDTATDTDDTGSDTEDTNSDDDTTDCTELTWYADTDDDGFGDPDSDTINDCDRPDGYTTDNTDLNDGDPGVQDITVVCVTDSNGEWFSVAVLNLSSGDSSHWFSSDGTIASPLFVVDSSSDSWCAEYPEADESDMLKLSGLGTTDEGDGDFLVYSCGGITGDTVNYDGDTTCSVVDFTVNGYTVGWATDSYDYQYTP